MRNKELIEELQKFDPEAYVVVGNYETSAEYVEKQSDGALWIY